jgi:hypothetical protein
MPTPRRRRPKKNLRPLIEAYELVRQFDPEYRGAAPWAELHLSQRTIVWAHRLAITSRAKRIKKRLSARGIDTRSAETEGFGPKGESPTPQGARPESRS